MNAPSFIAFLKTKRPHIWKCLEEASLEGLIAIHEASDSVSASNRLLLTYPGLHEVLAYLQDEWALNHVNIEATFSAWLTPEGKDKDQDNDHSQGRAA